MKNWGGGGSPLVNPRSETSGGFFIGIDLMCIRWQGYRLLSCSILWSTGRRSVGTATNRECLRMHIRFFFDSQKSMIFWFFLIFFLKKKICFFIFGNQKSMIFWFFLFFFPDFFKIKKNRHFLGIKKKKSYIAPKRREKVERWEIVFGGVLIVLALLASPRPNRSIPADLLHFAAATSSIWNQNYR